MVGGSAVLLGGWSANDVVASVVCIGMDKKEQRVWHHAVSPRPHLWRHGHEPHAKAHDEHAIAEYRTCKGASRFGHGQDDIAADKSTVAQRQA